MESNKNKGVSIPGKALMWIFTTCVGILLITGTIALVRAWLF